MNKHQGAKRRIKQHQFREAIIKAQQEGIKKKVERGEGKGKRKLADLRPSRTRGH